MFYVTEWFPGALTEMIDNSSADSFDGAMETAIMLGTNFANSLDGTARIERGSVKVYDGKALAAEYAVMEGGY